MQANSPLARSRATAKTAVEMASPWKPQNGFHRDLEISHRTRDSHIPTSRSVVRLTREKNGEPTTDNDIEPPSRSSCPWWPVLRCRSVDSGQSLTKKAHSNPRRPDFY